MSEQLDGIDADFAAAGRTIERLESELETERMRLIACGVVAGANTRESAAKARDMLPKYYSGSYEDVARAVDREMALRERVEQLEAENEQLKTVPMRYRRLAFNAKLQDENDELRNRVEQLEVENKELRRKLARMNEMLNDVTVRPAAWMHDQPDRFDVIHAEAKALWLKAWPKQVEHYTIPLYRHQERQPLSTDDACALLRNVLGIDPVLDGNMLKMLRMVDKEMEDGIGTRLDERSARAARSNGDDA